ncbi:MAG: EamA family transporter, partial [Okeania sp. SIO2D1]|nr:EamA family transporter [Okeania sp. SIO2D1]
MELIGQIAIFLATLCYALNGVSTRRMPAANNIDKATAVVITATLFLLLACVMFEPFDDLGRASFSKWMILLYLGLVPTAL